MVRVLYKHLRPTFKPWPFRISIKGLKTESVKRLEENTKEESRAVGNPKAKIKIAVIDKGGYSGPKDSRRAIKDLRAPARCRGQ